MAVFVAFTFCLKRKEKLKRNKDVAPQDIKLTCATDDQEE